MPSLELLQPDTKNDVGWRATPAWDRTHLSVKEATPLTLSLTTMQRGNFTSLDTGYFHNVMKTILGGQTFCTRLQTCFLILAILMWESVGSDSFLQWPQVAIEELKFFGTNLCAFVRPGRCCLVRSSQYVNYSVLQMTVCIICTGTAFSPMRIGWMLARWKVK